MEQKTVIKRLMKAEELLSEVEGGLSSSSKEERLEAKISVTELRLRIYNCELALLHGEDSYYTVLAIEDDIWSLLDE